MWKWCWAALCSELCARRGKHPSPPWGWGLIPFPYISFWAIHGEADSSLVKQPLPAGVPEPGTGSWSCCQPPHGQVILQCVSGKTRNTSCEQLHLWLVMGCNCTSFGLRHGNRSTPDQTQGLAVLQLGRVLVRKMAVLVLSPHLRTFVTNILHSCNSMAKQI